MTILFSACTGSLSRSLGLVAATMSRFDEAERHFDTALRMNQHLGARPWVAHTEHAYARLLLTREGPGDRERAHGLLYECSETAQRSAYGRSRS